MASRVLRHVTEETYTTQLDLQTYGHDIAQDILQGYDGTLSTTESPSPVA